MRILLHNPAVGNGLGEILIEKLPFTVGRSSSADRALLAPFISRLHCRFSLQGDEVLVEDLETPNGTFLNGEPVREATPIRHGDVVSLGPLAYRVCLRDLPAGTSNDPAAPVGNEQSTLMVNSGSAPAARARQVTSRAILPP